KLFKGVSNCQIVLWSLVCGGLVAARGFTQVSLLRETQVRGQSEGLCLTCEAPSRSEGSPKGFPRYARWLCEGGGLTTHFLAKHGRTNLAKTFLRRRFPPLLQNRC